MDAALAKAHASFIASHSGEDAFEYRRHPGGAFVSAAGHVREAPVDAFGQVQADTLLLWMSKEDLPAPTLQKDQVRRPQKVPGGPLPIFRVVEVVDQGPGHWWLRAVRCAD
jgi:hypothetical protein